MCVWAQQGGVAACMDKSARVVPPPSLYTLYRMSCGVCVVPLSYMLGCHQSGGPENSTAGGGRQYI